MFFGSDSFVDAKRPLLEASCYTKWVPNDEPGKADPSGPSRFERGLAEPGRAGPSRAKPSGAEPEPAHPPTCFSKVVVSSTRNTHFGRQTVATLEINDKPAAAEPSRAGPSRAGNERFVYAKRHFLTKVMVS